jgi:hypothetical protein
MEANFYDLVVICLWALGACCLVWVLLGFGGKRR